MEPSSLESLTQKLGQLPYPKQQEVQDFIDFLIERQKFKRENINKKELLEISTWSDEDLEIFSEIRDRMNQWTVKEF
jgi:hypothetical protein